MGIGGTGSVTVASTIANAARLDGKFVVGLDQTGLAQKGGPVISDIKVSKERFVGSNKITDGSTDLYLGFDILNATDYKNFDKCHPDRTIAVVSTGKAQTGKMAADRKVKFPEIGPLTRAIDNVTRKADNVFVDAPGHGRGPVRRQHGHQHVHGRMRVPVGRAADRGPLDREARSSRVASASTWACWRSSGAAWR